MDDSADLLSTIKLLGNIEGMFKVFRQEIKEDIAELKSDLANTVSRRELDQLEKRVRLIEELIRPLQDQKNIKDHDKRRAAFIFKYGDKFVSWGVAILCIICVYIKI